MDGTCVRVPDTDQNFEAFDKPSARGENNDSAYPQVRIAAPMNLDTRMLVDAAMGAHELAKSYCAVGSGTGMKTTVLRFWTADLQTTKVSAVLSTAEPDVTP